MVNSFDAPARQAFVVDMVEDRQDLMNAIALNSAIFNAARVLGPSIAGISLSVVGPAWCFFLNAVSFIAVIIGLWLMQVQPTTKTAASVSLVAQLQEGLGYIWHNETLRTLIALVAVANFFAFGYSTLLPAFAQDVLRSGPTGLGLLSGAVGMGALTGALMIASLGEFHRKGMLLTFGNLLFPMMVLLFSASRALPLSMVILVGVGMSFMVQNATANTLIQTTVRDQLRGRVMSIYMMVMNGLLPLGALLAGLLAEYFGVPAGAGLGAIVALTFGLLLLWRAPSIRKLT